jgi:hypothetical protein
VVTAQGIKAYELRLKLAKMNIATDQNETHVGCAEYNRNTRKKTLIQFG